jgi:hypothetical protein
MKTYAIFFLITLCGSCTTLMNPQEQPVRLIDSQTKIYSTTCSGVVETIGTCHEKARRTCKQGYHLLDESRDNSGAHRQIRFQCKE